MVKVQQAILVEGRYDKNTLSQIVDAPIFETSGFGIFKNKEQMALLRRVAERQGLIVFTDSDTCSMLIFRIFPARSAGRRPPEKKESWA